ncbi:MAG: TolC family protein [Flammeovirgaceae bacterium]|nr:TolC family protein [Flammeovirgaceae bacterium]
MRTMSQPREYPLTLPEAKTRLLKENLVLLAHQYEVSIAEAELLQAKLLPNPTISWEQEAYSRQKREYFNAGNQYAVEVSQLLPLAGKYAKNIRLAELTVTQKKYVLEEVLRSLLYELSTKYIDLAVLQAKDLIYKDMRLQYETLIFHTQERVNVGTTAPKEVFRLQSEKLNIEAEITQNRNMIVETLAQLRLMLNLPPDVVIVANEPVVPESFAKDFNALLEQAYAQRPEAKLSAWRLEYEQANLKWQKSLRFPDIEVALQYDKGSNYTTDYRGIGLRTNLPLFNRNQGGIRMADARIKQAEIERNQTVNTIANEVTMAWLQLENSKKGLELFSKEHLRKMEELNDNANLNYEKRYINLLEFLDLQRIYLNSKLQYLNLKYELLKSIQLINYVVGTEVF